MFATPEEVFVMHVTATEGHCELSNRAYSMPYFVSRDVYALNKLHLCFYCNYFIHLVVADNMLHEQTELRVPDLAFSVLLQLCSSRSALQRFMQQLPSSQAGASQSLFFECRHLSHKST